MYMCVPYLVQLNGKNSTLPKIDVRNPPIYRLRPKRPISLRISCSTVIPPWEFNA